MASFNTAVRPYILLQHLVHAYKAKMMDSTADVEWLRMFIGTVDPTIARDANLKRLQLLEALGPFVDRFNEANEERDIENAFIAFYGSINFRFGSKPIMSSQAIKSIASSFQESAEHLDFGNLEQLRFETLQAFTFSDVECSDTEFLNMCLKEIQHLFFLDADFDLAFKALFEKLGYDISEEGAQPISDEQGAQVISDEEVSRALKASMAVPFRGLSATALFTYLTDCHQIFASGSVGSQLFYGRFICICNSSGTGKTRAILELRNSDIPVLYINMRPSGDTKNYPPRDDIIAQLFDPAFRSSANDYYHICLKVFCAIFELLIPEFNKPDQCLADKIDRWNTRYTDDVSRDNVKRREFFSKVQESFDKMQEDCTGSKQRLLAAYMNLCRSLESQKNFLVLALDETQAITECPRAQPWHDSPSHMLTRAIADFTRTNGPAVWVLFSSTNSRITHFAAPAPFHNSARVANNRELLFTPFSALEWDVYAEPGDKLDFRSVGEFKTTISFGRPLWKSVLALHPNPDEMTVYAYDKLLCRQEGSYPEEDAYLALLGQRFALSIDDGSHRSVPFIAKGIASNMRFLVSTSQNRMKQYSTYPSEPVLSHAAASYMHSEDNLVKSLDVLSSRISSGLIQAGELGELMSRLLILIARDFAAIHAYDIGVRVKPNFPERYHQYYKPFPSTPGLQYFAYLRPVPLLLVLCILFGDEWILSNPGCIKAFERAYISASHWIRMAEDVAPRPSITKEDYLKDLFLRGMALQCHHQQDLIDGFFPILFLNDADEVVGMSTVSEQSKNWQKRANPAAFVNIADESIDLGTGYPHVVIGLNHGDAKTGDAAFSVSYQEHLHHDDPKLTIQLHYFSEPDLKVLACTPRLAEAFKTLKNANQNANQSEAVMKHLAASALYGSIHERPRWWWREMREVKKDSAKRKYDSDSSSTSKQRGDRKTKKRGTVKRQVAS
ncbi:hypothetical protein VKT23_013664 [Stygiomarasmius scandens]|uniref:Uncharacterized protein n=1 Tax=Marasmiellus scandens TaxID=2682957 RepID=A0ABR1J2Z9_9AGAR